MKRIISDPEPNTEAWASWRSPQTRSPERRVVRRLHFRVVHGPSLLRLTIKPNAYVSISPLLLLLVLTRCRILHKS